MSSVVLSKNELSFYEKKFIFFKNKFSLIEKIKLNDKIGIINDEIYLDEYSWNRYFKRRYYNQSYLKVNNYLKQQFNLFVKFLDQYLEIVKILKNKIILTNNLYYFIKNMINGLYNLKKSYPKNNEIINTINGIILTLYHFNEKIEDNLLIKSRKNSI